MNKKGFVIVFLATFCLTATLFMVTPTRSNPSSSDPNYNAWADINANGIVDIYDAITLSGSFNLQGDPTRPVIVTNPKAKVIEQDVNISVSNGGYPSSPGYGYGSTSIISTEGYDRMFVSAAIIDISNYNDGQTIVYLQGVSWCWGIINGKQMNTMTPADYDRQLRLYLWDTSYIPYGNGTEEFAVEAIQCSLPFYASTWFSSGWVLLRVSVYLTTGTTSPPSVQNTYVTNWPYSQAQPAFDTPWLYQNTSIYNGYYYYAVSVNVGGYSRMSISIEIENCSYHSVPVTTNVSLYGVNWGGPGATNIHRAF